MKNFWLVTGGISIGLGLAYSRDDKKTKGQTAFQLIGGSIVVAIGLYGFKK